MTAAALAPKPILDSSGYVQLEKAKVLQTSDTLSLFSFDRLDTISSLFARFRPECYANLTIDEGPCRAFSFNNRIKKCKQIYDFIPRLGFDPFKKGEAFSVLKDIHPIKFYVDDGSDCFYLQKSKKTIAWGKDQCFYLFHFHFSYPLKIFPTLYAEPEVKIFIRSYEKNNPFGLSACVDDATNPASLVTRTKLKNIARQIFNYPDHFEDNLCNPEILIKEIRLIKVPSLSAPGFLDHFLFHKGGLIVLPCDSHKWEGSYKEVYFSYSIAEKILPCVTSFCHSIEEFKQEKAIRTHERIKSCQSIPKIITWWNGENRIFVSEFASFGSLHSFLSSNSMLSIKDRNQLVHSLLDAFIETSFLLHKDINPDNLLVTKDPITGWKILINDFGSSALKQSACDDSNKAIQAKKIKELTANTHCLSPEMIFMSYESTRLLAQKQLLEKASKEGRVIDPKDLENVTGVWFNQSRIAIDGSLRADLDLTEDHWDKTTVFILGQLIFEIFFNHNLYDELFDIVEFDEDTPIVKQTLAATLRNPKMRFYLEDLTSSKNKEEYETLKILYEKAHTYLLDLQTKKRRQTYTDAPIDPFTVVLSSYPEKLEDALLETTYLQLIDESLKRLSLYESMTAILEKSYHQIIQKGNILYFHFLARFIYLRDEIDLDTEIFLTEDNKKLRSRLSIINGMLKKDPSKRISLEEAKKIFEDLDKEDPF